MFSKNFLLLPFLLVTYTLISGFLSKPSLRVFECAWDESEKKTLVSKSDEEIINETSKFDDLNASTLINTNPIIFNEKNGQFYKYDKFMNTVKPTSSRRVRDPYFDDPIKGSYTYIWSKNEIKDNILSYHTKYTAPYDPSELWVDYFDFKNNVAFYYDEDGAKIESVFCRNIRFPDNVEVLSK